VKGGSLRSEGENVRSRTTVFSKNEGNSIYIPIDLYQVSPFNGNGKHRTVFLHLVTIVRPR
jgi:hypothetical protein